MNKNFFLALLILVIFGIFVVLYFPILSQKDECEKCHLAKLEIDKILVQIELGKKIFETLDPWGRPYYVESFAADSKKCYVVFTFGADGLPSSAIAGEPDIAGFTCADEKWHSEVRSLPQ